MSDEVSSADSEARVIAQLAELGSSEDLEDRLQAFLKPYVDKAMAADGWAKLVEAALSLGRVPVALVFAEQQADLDPSNIQTQYNFGLIQAWSDQSGAAQATARKLIEKHPDDDAGYLLTLDILQMTGKWVDMPTWWSSMFENEVKRLANHPQGREGLRFLNHNHGIVHRFGETATQLDPFVKSLQLGWREAGKFRLLAPHAVSANPAYLDYWRDYIEIIDDEEEINRQIELAGELRIHTRFVRLPDGRFISKMQGQAAIQQVWQQQARPPLLKLRHDHRARGREAMEKLGLPAEAWFACLHVREGGYLRPHEAEIHAFRDADIDTYMTAVEAITARGGWVVRLGDPSMKELTPLPRVIDYAHSGLRADWLDVYLLGAARFVLGTTSGPTPVAATFGTPVIMTNMVPHGERGPNQRSLFLPKLYRRRQGDFIPFREMLAGPNRWLWNGKLLDRDGLEIVDNTAEELRDVTVEMMDRLDQGVEPSDQQDRRQAAYRALFDRDDDFDTGSRIGSAFIEKYQELL